MSSDLTIQQRQALALAAARRRRAEEQAPQATPDRSGLEKAVNLGASYVQGRTLGMGPKIGAAVGSILAYPAVAAGKAIQGQDIPSLPELYKLGYEMYSAPSKAAREDNPMLAGLAELGGGLTTGVKIAGTKAGKGLASWIKNLTAQSGTGMLPAAVSLGKKAAVGGILGEAGYRQYNAATAEPGGEVAALLEPNITPGGMFGAGLPVAGAIAGAVGKPVMNAVGPKLDDASKGAAKVVSGLAKKHGIDLKVSDIATSGKYKRIITQGEKMPMSGADDFAEKTQMQINRAATKTLGETADKVTPEYMNKVRKTLGNDFQNLTKGKEFTIPAEAYTKLDEMGNVASRKGYGADGEALFNQYKAELETLIDDRGIIKGDKLDKFRRDLSAVARKQSTSDIGQVASDFEDAVVDIISDSDPAILKQITDMKYKYKNYKTLLSPAARNQATGDINPAALSGAVQRIWGLDAFATGRAGDLGDIARIGQALRLPSSSGTAENLMAQRGVLENALRTPQYIGNAMLQGYNRNPQSVQKMLSGGTNLPAIAGPQINPMLSTSGGLTAAQLNQMLGGQ